MPVHRIDPYNPVYSGGSSGSGSGSAAGRSSGSGSGSAGGGGTQSQSYTLGQQQANAASSSFIPEYSQTPILQTIAQYAGQMAPEVYNWGMTQFNRNQGNIDAMMRSAMSYASPERVAQEMGQAQAGVMQGAEAGRQNAIRDLESYGIDPSSGRYAALDQASRVQAGAAAAGAGNQQRMATQAMGNTMQQQALQAGMANVGLGYQAGQGMNQLLGTGMQLPYSPLGTQSTSSSSQYNVGENVSGPAGSTGMGTGMNTGMNTNPAFGTLPSTMRQEGGFIDDSESPTGGAAVDDVKANLTSGEFVIPKDVTEWKGQEFFYKLMAQARKMRATAGTESNGMGYQESNGGMEPEQTGYAIGGSVAPAMGAGRFTDEKGFAPPMVFPEAAAPSGAPQNLTQLMAANPSPQPLQPPIQSGADSQYTPEQQQQIAARDWFTQVMSLPPQQRQQVLANYQNNQVEALSGGPGGGGPGFMFMR